MRKTLVEVIRCEKIPRDRKRFRVVTNKYTFMIEKSRLNGGGQHLNPSSRIYIEYLGRTPDFGSMMTALHKPRDYRTENRATPIYRFGS